MTILNLTAKAQLDALQKGRISSVELLELTIARAESLVPSINPFALTLYQQARESAVTADEKLANGTGGKLCGLPVTIKDSQFFAGHRCANGSKTLENFIPQETCHAIKLLEAEDAVIFAKTTCPEFSLTGITQSNLYGLTTNPWDINRTCGGSSGGAGAAVASGLGAFSLGGDGGGSIRIPSAFCGVVGFKPSFGAIPREPCFPSWQSIVSYGPITRSVEDARIFFEILGESHTEIQSLQPTNRYIVSEDLGFAPVDDCIRRHFRALVEKMNLNDIETIADQPGLPSSVITWAVTASYDAYNQVRQKTYDQADVGETATAFLNFGAEFSAEHFNEAQAYRDVIRQTYQEMFERNQSQILITPTLGCEAFEHGSIHPKQIGETPIELPWIDWAGFLYDANLAELPACAIPMGVSDNGMPVSVQILGPAGSDWAVLRVAEQLENLIGWDNSIVTPIVHSNPAVSAQKAVGH
ncbi:MAG: Asp-tRNA(Asn)/Glu-tRNA(Gln) amidotransferase A subunit family amidase [Gammaproteobacteria bacterium]|jgi:Asp-tRNA(Asn)/Glu-tRNA(Gln) amidotransferase A subunit family amidase